MQSTSSKMSGKLEKSRRSKRNWMSRPIETRVHKNRRNMIPLNPPTTQKKMQGGSPDKKWRRTTGTTSTQTSLSSPVISVFLLTV